MRSTEDHVDKTDADYLPWPRHTIISKPLHTNILFFRDLLSDLKTFDKLLNLDGICNLVGELLKSADVCQYSGRSNDNMESSDPDVGLDGNSSAGMIGPWTCSSSSWSIRVAGSCAHRTTVYTRDFIILEEWIPRVKKITEMWIRIQKTLKAR